LKKQILSAYKCMECLGCQFLHPGGRYATKRLIEKLNISSDDKILEIGCGTGNTARFIHSLTSANIVGIDIDDAMIVKAKKTTSKNQQKLKFMIGSGDNIPFDDNSFDVIISEGTTFFMETKKALKEYYRVLKPTGRIGLVEISYFKTPPVELENLTTEVTCCYGMKPLLFDEWEKQIRQAGFIIENVDRKNMHMCMGSMIHSEGFWNTIKININMMIKPYATKRMMSIMKHYNKYQDYFGFGIFTAYKKG
jgi:ubiquinone/menaquinone biosynthesis C-methylase UbiE